MKYSKTQEQKMLVELEEFFSFVPRLDKNHKVNISFPDRTVMENSALRISISTPHTSDLEMVSFHDFMIKKVNKITKLKMKTVNAFIFKKPNHTELVAMFE